MQLNRFSHLHVLADAAHGLVAAMAEPLEITAPPAEKRMVETEITANRLTRVLLDMSISLSRLPALLSCPFDPVVARWS